MIVRSFLAWYDTAPMHERIEAVQMMAQCTLSGDLGGDSQQEAESALTLVLDDPAISVRAALAWELALSDKAPRHLILGLAHDQAEAAALVLARSPLLGDADLVECVRNGDPLNHLAIASRTHVSAVVAAALASAAGSKALIGLIENPGAELSDETLRTILSRHEGDAGVREALHTRPNLPADVRQRLIALVSADLLGFVQGRGWLAEKRAERTVCDARDCATITLAGEADDLARYIAHLAQSGQLTASLLIRSLLTGDTSLFGAALVCLADVAPNRVAGMLRGKAGSALAATCVRAGISRPLVPVFTAALTAIAEMPRGFVPDGSTPQRAIISRVLSACLLEEGEELKPVLAMLRRLDAELARADARAAIVRMKQAEPVLLDAVATALELDETDVFDVVDGTEDGATEALPDLVPVMLPMFETPHVAAEPVLAAQPLPIQPLPVVAAEMPAVEPVVAAPVAPAAQDVAEHAPRVIHSPRAPERIPDDLAKLFNELFSDEARYVPPLEVLEGKSVRDERYFAGAANTQSKAA